MELHCVWINQHKSNGIRSEQKQFNAVDGAGCFAQHQFTECIPWIQ